MVVLDTSVLIGALTGPHTELPSLRRMIAQGDVPLVSAPVHYEWLRGPRSPEELASQEWIAPSENVAAFGEEEARIAAALYKRIPRPRSREIDICIAAFAIARGAPLWTLNRRDFADIPNLVFWNAA